jgi:PleD family two-component response regulator
VAENIVKECRKVDALGRWCTEAFMIIVPGTHLSDAARLTEKARKIFAYRIFLVAGESIKVSMFLVLRFMRKDNLLIGLSNFRNLFA